MKLLSALAQLYINYSLKQLCIQDSRPYIEMIYIVLHLIFSLFYEFITIPVAFNCRIL